MDNASREGLAGRAATIIGGEGKEAGKIAADGSLAAGTPASQLLMMQRIAEQVAEGVAVVDNEGRFSYVNPAFVAMHAAEGQLLLGESYTLFYAEEELARRVQPIIDAALRDGVGRGETQRRRLDGSCFPALISVSQLLDDSGQRIGRILGVSDISERKQFEADLVRQALIDPLTGLPNRRLLLDRLTHALQRAGRSGTRVAVLFLDLDQLKRINDEHGHAAGDAALKTAAARFNACLRTSDTLARLSGDEFVVLLEDSDPERAADVAARLHAALHDPVELRGATALLSTSIGVHVASGGSAHDLLEAADQAMYAAKRSEPAGTRFSEHPAPAPTPSIIEGRAGALLRRLNTSAPWQLADVLHEHLVELCEARGSTLLLADYEGRTLEPVPGSAMASVTGSQRVETSPAGQVFREQEPLVVRQRSGLLAYLPVSIRAERLGVLEVHLGGGAERAITALGEVAALVAQVVAGARRYTDRFEQIRRRGQLGLAAELQWELLPVLAYDAPEFSLAGSLEPAYDIGGDSFDYAVAPQTLALSVVDAMGHGLRAAMMASLAVTAARNVRRGGGGLVEQVQTAAARVVEQFPDGFVTGTFIHLDVPSGAGALVNAGHVPALLVRGGRVRVLTAPAELPLGLFPGTCYSPVPLRLQPGDRLLLSSDGLADTGPIGGEAFGEERIASLLGAAADLPVAELVRQLTRSVIEHAAGQLRDDATAVCLEWRGEG